MLALRAGLSQPERAIMPRLNSLRQLANQARTAANPRRRLERLGYVVTLPPKGAAPGNEIAAEADCR
jgi:hypothetical protein